MGISRTCRNERREFERVFGGAVRVAKGTDGGLFICMFYKNMLVARIPVDDGEDADGSPAWLSSLATNLHTTNSLLTLIKTA